MRKLWEGFVKFLKEEFTIQYCDKHPNQKLSKWIGCEQCYAEAIWADKQEAKERRIAEITEAIIRADKKIKEGQCPTND